MIKTLNFAVKSLIIFTSFFFVLHCKGITQPDEEGQTSEGFQYQRFGSEVVITGYNGASTYVYIPRTIKGYTVRRIGDGAFENSILMSVFVPGTIERIGDNAFRGSTMLTQIDLENGIREVGFSAFSRTSLYSITLPSTVTSVSSEAFSSCFSLREVRVNAWTPPFAGNNIFLNSLVLNSIAVPSGAVDRYKTTVGWSQYAHIIVSQ